MEEKTSLYPLCYEVIMSSGIKATVLYALEREFEKHLWM